MIFAESVGLPLLPVARLCSVSSFAISSAVLPSHLLAIIHLDLFDIDDSIDVTTSASSSTSS